MSLYAVKNDEGKWLRTDTFGTVYWKDEIYDSGRYIEVLSAHHDAKRSGGHVVELVEAPAKVVVPAWFDDFVQKYEDNLANEEQARFRIIGKICQSGWGTTFNDQLNRDVPDNFNPFDLDDGQLKYVHAHRGELVRALSLNSWTVEKPKRYVLPMPYGADDDDPDDSHYAMVNREYHAGPAWHQGPCVSFKKAQEQYSVTQADIDAAPDWVKAIKPVEVQDE